ncbi:LysE family transporter [Kribbella deserti]|uniref:LysE family transporter n=1 Tax=Kribbella deserti TaxID=1926257 RepID=A0ABV6QJI5_9ACTN
MTAALVAGLLAGFGIAIPVGAVATYLVALTARTSWKTGAFAALGVATADGLYALIAAVGGAALAPLLLPILLPLRLVSVLVLLGLAFWGGLKAVRHYRDRRMAVQRSDAPRHPYLSLLGMTMLNPTTVIYFAALILGSQASLGPVELAVFVLAAFTASASWQLLLACGGALLGRILTGERGRLATTLVSSCLITGFALNLLF